MARPEFVKRFLEERTGALLSMDKEIIQQFFRKHNGREIKEELFWETVHMARTGDKTLPVWERAASKEWLRRRGLRSMDNGEVLPPVKKADLRRYFARLEEWGDDA